MESLSAEKPKAPKSTRVFVVSHNGTPQCIVSAHSPIQAGILAVDVLKARGVDEGKLAGIIQEGWPQESDVELVDQSRPNAIDLG